MIVWHLQSALLPIWLRTWQWWGIQISANVVQMQIEVQMWNSQLSAPLIAKPMLSVHAIID
ncbi:hypothetical protein [Segetibacter koreensis]|uniref:hypothetical protein n=1 Tax=Segetibacter koreensis TaxID=398037 RepID=UPI00036BE3C9|nr:hypothetical protein [Segetibacter koreensis]